MSNPNYPATGQGPIADGLVAPNGTAYTKAAGRVIPSTGGYDASVTHLFDQPNYAATPFPVLLANAAGTLGAGTYYYRVSALTSLGETVPSTEVSLTILINTGALLSWPEIPGATGYKVYGRSTGAELLMTTVTPGTVLSFHDDGSLTPSGAMPTVNTAVLTQAIEGPLPSTGTLANVAGSASSVTLLSANSARRGATITNDSTAALYVKLAASAASLTSYTAVLAGAASEPFAYYETPFGYTGEIRGIWASAAGNARVTELTA